MSRRTQRISSLIRVELSRLLLTEVQDPVVRNLVITEVEVTADLKQAKVFYELFEAGALPKKTELQKGLKRVSPFLRHGLAENLELRAVPELHFIEDEHTREVTRVMSLLDSVAAEKSTSRSQKDATYVENNPVRASLKTGLEGDSR